MAAILGVRPLRERNFKGRALRGKSKGSFWRRPGPTQGSRTDDDVRCLEMQKEMEQF
jgi:hypothetical protein